MEGLQAMHADRAECTTVLEEARLGILDVNSHTLKQELFSLCKSLTTANSPGSCRSCKRLHVKAAPPQLVSYLDKHLAVLATINSSTCSGRHSSSAIASVTFSSYMV